MRMTNTKAAIKVFFFINFPPSRATILSLGRKSTNFDATKKSRKKTKVSQNRLAMMTIMAITSAAYCWISA